MTAKLAIPLILAISFGFSAPSSADRDRERLTPTERVDRLFKRLDVNEDDLVSRSEVKDTRLENRFDKIDTDESGTLSRAEVLEHIKKPKDRKGKRGERR